MPKTIDLPYAVFRQLSLEGVDLRKSAEFGEGLAAALWHRDEIAETSYHRPNHHTLSLYASGGEHIQRRLGQRLLQSFGPGTLCLMPAAVTTDWLVAGAIDLFHLYVPTALFNRVVASALDRDSMAIELPDRPFFSDPLLEHTMRLAFLQKDWHDPADRLAISHAAHLIITHLIRCHSDKNSCVRKARGGLAPVVRRRLAEFIDANLEAPLVVGDLAAVAGLSEFHFIRMFRHSTGESPHAFVLRRRIERAKTLLGEQGLPLRDIALACGFSSQSHFTARFRHLTGVTPRRYRMLA